MDNKKNIYGRFINECISSDGRLLIAEFEDGTSRMLAREEWFTAGVS